MSNRILLELGEEVHAEIRRHLIRPRSKLEQAAFVFARHEADQGSQIFRCIEWFPVPPEGFVVQTEAHFELTDETRALVIKRAHDLGACLVELHAHTGPWKAQFSGSDRLGFREFVPHVWWRLKGRPYVAVVVSRSGHDGLVWMQDPKSPERLTGLLVGGRVLSCTGLSPLSSDDGYE
jgi:hypothetical protein